MNLINHEVLGEGYYFLNTYKELTLITKNYTKLAKKLYRRGYESLTKEQLDDTIKTFLQLLANVVRQFTITFLDTNETVSNILYLWYDNGFCHYQIIKDGVVEVYTTSALITVNSSKQKIDNYPIIKKVDCYTFGDYIFGDKTIYANDIEKLYKMYGDTNANN